MRKRTRLGADCKNGVLFESTVALASPPPSAAYEKRAPAKAGPLGGAPDISGGDGVSVQCLERYFGLLEVELHVHLPVHFSCSRELGLSFRFATHALI